MTNGKKQLIRIEEFNCVDLSKPIPRRLINKVDHLATINGRNSMRKASHWNTKYIVKKPKQEKGDEQDKPK